MIPRILKSTFGKVAVLILAVSILSVQLYEAGKKSQKNTVDCLESTVKNQTSTIKSQNRVIEQLAKNPVGKESNKTASKGKK